MVVFLQDSSLPEIQRCSLATVVLQLLVLGVRDVINFDFMDPPSPDTLMDALGLLSDLGENLNKYMCVSMYVSIYYVSYVIYPFLA